MSDNVPSFEPVGPTQVRVDVKTYLSDCPPWDEEIPEPLLTEISLEIARRFDSTDIYGQIDDLACLLLREHGLAPAGEED